MELDCSSPEWEEGFAAAENELECPAKKYPMWSQKYRDCLNGYITGGGYNPLEIYDEGTPQNSS